jgi:hypothetical protein
MTSLASQGATRADVVKQVVYVTDICLCGRLPAPLDQEPAPFLDGVLPGSDLDTIGTVALQGSDSKAYKHNVSRIIIMARRLGGVERPRLAATAASWASNSEAF